jgi:hypothetical protein
MATPRPIRWLHLSDLHLGHREREQWWGVEKTFADSVRREAERLGPPDLLLLTGDLANLGTRAEYDLADAFLEALFGWLREAGAQHEPLLLPVPGNHDIERPSGTGALGYGTLERYHLGLSDGGVRTVHDELWGKTAGRRPTARFVRPLFKHYQAWFRRTALPALERRTRALHLSHFPVDFTAEIALRGVVPVAVVGLNSTWQQIGPGDRERKLVLPAEQLFAALPRAKGGNPLALFDRRPRALLLMHHPPGWLSAESRRSFQEEIYPAGRFDLCLHGHLHDPESRSESIGGSRDRRYFQAPSLFGLERWGEPGGQRRVGYAWGELAADGTVRLWPQAQEARAGGSVFAFDRWFEADAEDGLVLAGEDGSPSLAPARSTPRPGDRPVDFTRYLEDLAVATGTIDIRGLSYQAGGNRTAERHPIESLYVPLSTRAPAAERPARRGHGGTQGPLAEVIEAELRAVVEAGEPPDRVDLATLLPRHRRLLIQGAAGAGKSTFLRLIANLLARDLLGRPGPEGSSWRHRHLGLPEDEPPRLPVLLRIGQLAALMTAADAPKLRHDNHTWLLELVGRLDADNGYGIPRAEWQRRLDRGEAILLFDGLDEVADEELRGRIFQVFSRAAAEWACPIVVTSRPIQTAALVEAGFHEATVEPFGREAIGRFVGAWAAALGGVASAAALHGEPERLRRSLLEQIDHRDELLRLAVNPVMLTCLCVVHWNEGELPDGRSKVYAALLRWLLAARDDLRRETGYTKAFAREGLARLALAMMTGERGKVAETDLAAAAATVDGLLAREFRGVSASPGRRQKAIDWLRFECLHGGVVEEIAGNRLKFWHLTFQEYLAAVRLAEGEEWWQEIEDRLDDPQWRETLEMLPGCLHEGGRGGPDRLLRRVAEVGGRDADLETRARTVARLGRLLQALAPYEYAPEPALAERFAALRGDSLAIFEPEGVASVPFEVRLEAARVIGRWGDPRLATAGESEIDGFLGVPGHGALRLGRFPVTVAEYRRFVDAGGYSRGEHWSRAGGWAWRQSEGVEEPREWSLQLANPNHPVTGVSWYEAAAYCAWLGERLDGWEARLPAGDEWYGAARAVYGAYPWGYTEPSAERAHFGYKVGGPTPVGLYPAGAGPHGHLDLAGGVWEWCEDTWGEDDENRVLRGGSWAVPAGLLRSALRRWLPAGYRVRDFGFRVAVVPAST